MGKIRDKQESYGQYRLPKCQFLNLCITFFLHETPILYRGHILRRGWDGAGYDYNMIIT